jgi:hypothetical protein
VLHAMCCVRALDPSSLLLHVEQSLLTLCVVCARCFPQLLLHRVKRAHVGGSIGAEWGLVDGGGGVCSRGNGWLWCFGRAFVCVGVKCLFVVDS